MTLLSIHDAARREERRARAASMRRHPTRRRAYRLIITASIAAAAVGGFLLSSTKSAATASGQPTATRSSVSHTRCFGAAAMVAANDCPRPYARPKHLDTAAAANDGRDDPCLQSEYAPAAPVYCTFGQRRHPQQTLALIGNSHAWRLAPALSAYAKRHHWQIIEISRINCLGLITRAVRQGDGPSASCLSWAAHVERHLLALHRLTGVVFASYRFWWAFTTGGNPTSAEVDATRQQIRTMWKRYRTDDVKVFVVQDVPGMRPTRDPQCIRRSQARYDPCARSRNEVVRPTITTQLATQHPRLATYVPLAHYFCGTSKCHGLIGGVVVYFDKQHMTETYARTLGPYLGRTIAGAFDDKTADRS
jgi:hypothetical protein